MLRRCGWLRLLAASALISGSGCGGRDSAAVDSSVPSAGTGIERAPDESGVAPPGEVPGASLITEQGVGPITATSMRADLSAMFGAAAVTDTPYYIGEGFCVPGSVVLGGTPDELAVAWQDTDMSAVAVITTDGEGGRWSTPSGVRVGSSLAQLEALNGGPFTFSGFGWDYGGATGDWLGGQMQEELRPVTLRLTADDDALAEIGAPEIEVLLGDHAVRSDNPVARRARITVAGISVVLGPLPEESFCG